jgi:hypothetical protein
MTPKTPKKYKQRFEHDVMFRGNIGDVMKSLQEGEGEGWELTAVTPEFASVRKKPFQFLGYTLFFKRPV